MDARQTLANNRSSPFSQIPLLICHLLVYFEFLLFLGITLFLIISQRAALFIGSDLWYYFFPVPILACACIGILLRLKKPRKLGKKFLVWLQVAVCIVNYAIVAFLLYTDNLDYFQSVPALFGLFLCLFGLLLTNVIVLGEMQVLPGHKSDNRELFSLLLALGGIAVIILVLIDIFATLTFFFIFSAIFHGVYCFLLLFNAPHWSNHLERATKLQLGERFCRFFFLLVCLGLAWNQLGFFYSPPEDLAATYVFLFPTVASPLFIIGVLIPPILARYKGIIYGDLGAFVIALLSCINMNFLAPLLLGYSLASFTLFLNETNPSITVFPSVLALLGSMAGLYLLFFNVDVQVFPYYPLILSVVIGFLGCVLGVSIMFHFLHIKQGSKIKKNENPNAEGRLQ